MYEPHLNQLSNGNEDSALAHETILEDETSTTFISQHNSRPTIHWGPVVEGDSNGKEQINTETDHFDALFARSNASPSPPPHPRCYSSCSPATDPSLLTATASSHISAKSQPLLSSSKQKQPHDLTPDTSSRQSISSSSSSKNQQSNSSSARNKRKNFSLTHTAQTFLQATNSQNEQLEPLARSCSYKRPQSIKKYRQKKNEKEKEKDQEQYFSARKNSITTTSQNNPSLYTGTYDSPRKSVTARVSATDLMATDDQQDQWSSPSAQRSGRVGKIIV
jgi:hypothetical protein